MGKIDSAERGFFDERDGQWVVLTGAGISAPPPSAILSWWECNNEVLNGLKKRASEVSVGSSETRSAIANLSLDSVDLAEFSQIVYDSFAGGRWMYLLSALDGDQPNVVHSALASEAATGRVRVILTTNFDTLLEKAFMRLGVNHRVLLPTRDLPPSLDDDFDGALIVKLHGTIGEASTMVDLSTQKDAGLSSAWRGWLTRTFSGSPTLVIGFSGRDLELQDDYLGLFGAAPYSPELVWQTRTGTTDVPRVSELLSAMGDRARLVKAELPDYLAPDAAEGSVSTAALDSRRKLIESWFQRDEANPLLCYATILNLMVAAGMQTPAADLVSELRSYVYEIETFFDPRMALVASNVLKHVAVVETPNAPKVAHLDLTNALRLHRAGANALPANSPGHTSEELIRDEIEILNDLAQVHIMASDWTSARRRQLESARLLRTIPATPQVSALWGRNIMLSARIESAKGDHRGVTMLSRQAWFRFSKAGDRKGRKDALALRAWSAAALGEYPLARSFDLDSEVEDEIRTHFPPASIDQLLTRLEAECREPANRFDEVLYSVFECIRESSAFKNHSGSLRKLGEVLALASGEKGKLDLTRKLVVDAARRVLEPHSFESCIRVVDCVEYTLPGPRPVLHPVIAVQFLEIAQERGTDAVKRLRTRRRAGPDDIADLVISSGMFAAVGRFDDAVRAGLYLADALDRNGSYEDARLVLESNAAISPSEFNAAVLTRLSRVRAYSALRSGGDSLGSTLAAVLHNKWLIETHYGDLVEAGFVMLYVVLLHLALGDRGSAVSAAHEAVSLTAASEHAERVEAQLNELLGSGWAVHASN